MEGYEKENTIWLNGEYYDLCTLSAYHRIPMDVIARHQVSCIASIEDYVHFAVKDIVRQIADKLLSDGLIKVEQGSDFIRVSLDKILIPSKQE